jgi:D-alanine-D-alanine ligase-like ATP-grasp enzyme
MKGKESFGLSALFKKIAPSIGATVNVEPIWKIAGQINFKNGKKSYFRYNTLDLNPMGSSAIAKDKDYANFFMNSMNYPIVPNSKVFFSDAWAKAIGAKEQGITAASAHAVKAGFPIIIKPNSASHGSGVTKVYTSKEFLQVTKKLFLQHNIILVQKALQGTDIRIVVLDNEVISAYKRTPLQVVGDGVHTIKQLLMLKQAYYASIVRDTVIRLEDLRIKAKLKRSNMTYDTILQKGVSAILLDSANLSTGGESFDITSALHKSFKTMAIALTKDMGLRLCGVDIMVKGDITKAVSNNYHILEINSAPGMDHYALVGDAQKKVVEDLYTKILKHLEHM